MGGGGGGGSKVTSGWEGRGGGGLCAKIYVNCSVSSAVSPGGRRK